MLQTVTTYLEIEMQGARQFRAKSPETVLVFIMPRRWKLFRTSQKGNTETEEQIRLRFESACGEIHSIKITIIFS
jgi:guanylate kinase